MNAVSILSNEGGSLMSLKFLLASNIESVSMTAFAIWCCSAVARLTLPMNALGRTLSIGMSKNSLLSILAWTLRCFSSWISALMVSVCMLLKSCIWLFCHLVYWTCVEA